MSAAESLQGRTLSDALGAPDELQCRRILALLKRAHPSEGGVRGAA